MIKTEMNEIENNHAVEKTKCEDVKLIQPRQDKIKGGKGYK